MWYRCIATAVVAYTTTLSVGKMYGSKHNYKVDPNQELIALGITNLWASIWSCLASAASIPRSAVQENGGGRTQVFNLVFKSFYQNIIVYNSSLFYCLKSIIFKCNNFTNF